MAGLVAALGIAGCDEEPADTEGAETGGPAWVGTWERIDKIGNGQHLNNCEYELELTATTYRSVSFGSAACDCTNTGTVSEIEPGLIQWRQETAEGYCAAAGQTATYFVDYTLTEDGNELTLMTQGYDSTEVFARISDGVDGDEWDDGDDGDATPTWASCETDFVSECVDFVGDDLDEEAKESLCSSRMGVLSADPCTTSQRIGVCFIREGSPSGYNINYYEDPSRPVEAAELSCENQLNSRWQP